MSPSDDTRAAFIAAMRRVPGPVAIVAVAVDGQRRGLAATAWTSLCADPPTLLACVNRNASAHPILAEAHAFSISLLDRHSAETVAIFSAQRGLDGDARFVDGDWDVGPHGQPLFREAVAAFECVRTSTQAEGTHSILIGQATTVQLRADAEALLYLDGRFAGAVHHPAASAD